MPERRVLSIVHGPVFGGGNNQTMRLAEPLRRYGWETLAMVPDLPEARPAMERMRAGGLPTGMLELHRLRRTSDPRAHARFVASFRRDVGRLRGLIRRQRIDLVQAFGDTNPHLALAGHLEGKGVVWHLYDTVTPRALRRLTMPLVTTLADVVMTTGQGLADEYPGARSLGQRCIAVYPPVDLDAFAAAPARREPARMELGVPAGAPVVGTVGNRNPSKGHDHLARAVAGLRATVPDVHARVLGAESPVHAEHMAAVGGVVRALGMEGRIEFCDPGTRVPELMPAFDVFVLSSGPRSEGVPTVILEAMACGIPVVATDVGAVAEVVEHDVTGLVVPPADASALAAAIERVLTEPGLAARLGTTGRERAERYSAVRCAEAYDRAYTLALDHRARRR